VPRNKDEYPNVCPKCKSPYWDKPKKKININKSIKNLELRKNSMKVYKIGGRLRQKDFIERFSI
jgi:hypothetical protein